MILTYTLHRSRRRIRSTTLAVNKDGEIVVQAPLFIPKFIIDQFVQSKNRWITKQLAEKQTSPTKRVRYFTNNLKLQEFIEKILVVYQKQMALYTKGVTYKKVTSYWGRCTPDGKLVFNLELIYAPPTAIEYVVVHELAHLKYKDHGKRFWGLVNRYYPRANEIRKILRQIRSN